MREGRRDSDGNTGYMVRQREDHNATVLRQRTSSASTIIQRIRHARSKDRQIQKSFTNGSNDETLWFGLGKAYMGDENWEEAVSALENCLKVKPTYSAAILALAQSLKHANQPDRCRTVCAQGIDVATANGDLLVIKNLEELERFASY